MVCMEKQNIFFNQNRHKKVAFEHIKEPKSMTTPEMARKELIEFIAESGVSAKFLTEKLSWNYTNFIKFKSGKVNISVRRATLLHQYLTEYKQMISQL